MTDRPPFRQRMRRALAWVLGAMVLLSLLCASRFLCLSAFVFSGIATETCPSGDLLQTVEIEAYNLQRGGEGFVIVQSWAWFTTDRADEARRARVRRGSVTLSLVDATGAETPLSPKEGWDSDGGRQVATIQLPGMPDGDYKLRAKVKTPVGEAQHDLDLPLYAPAVGHLLTDRPLYEAGSRVQFRVMALRAADQVPLGGRPGVFSVVDPTGLPVFEERAPADDWGIAASDLPLDSDAPEGTWTLRWTSGNLVAQAPFDVRPFTLPRFSLSSSADRPWYGPGDAPVVRGRVVYASGAPVAEAQLRLDWSVDGEWPLPNSWRQGALPTLATTDRNGAFTLNLPAIPDDLYKQARLLARIDATSPTGDTESGSLSLLLSQDRVLADAVTELEDGLVEGFNNRVFLRVTTPDGQPLAKHSIRVRRAWDPRDPGLTAQTDEDGVAALQLDPGPPVNMMVPAPPVRPALRPDPVRRTAARDLVRGGDAPLADLLPLDRHLAGLQACARHLSSGSRGVRLGLWRQADGRVIDASASPDPLDRCLAEAHRGLALGPGVEGVLSVDYQVEAPDLPDLSVSIDAAPEAPMGLAEALRAAAADARRCLPLGVEGGELEELLAFSALAGSERPSLRWLPGGRGGLLEPGEQACVRGAFTDIRLPQPVRVPALGVARLRVSPAPSRAVEKPQPTALLGYELAISAEADGAVLGSTVLRLQPGSVPPIRLRMDPVLAKPGERVTVEVLRGPDLDADLPEDLYLRPPKGSALKGTLDPKTRQASFTLPTDQDGWYSLELWGAVARVYVAPTQTLAVSVVPGQQRYAPGALAELTVLTQSAGQPVSAAVGLVGVDASLGQLVSLPGPSALDGLRAPVTTDRPAFGALDGQALAMGRVRGANAAMATVLRVSQVPASADLEQPVSGSSAGNVDPVHILTDRFYLVLAALHERVRRWEREAPAEEQMNPARMAGFWREARQVVADAGGNPTDAYGRPLRLGWLPADLLALTDPRQVVVDGTRLPEDVERWDRYVAEEDPR